MALSKSGVKMHFQLILGLSEPNPMVRPGAYVYTVGIHKVQTTGKINGHDRPPTVFSFFFFLLFICAYNVWVISSPATAFSFKGTY
jgi:hypothetical protein